MFVTSRLDLFCNEKSAATEPAVTEVSMSHLIR